VRVVHEVEERRHAPIAHLEGIQVGGPDAFRLDSPSSPKTTRRVGQLAPNARADSCPSPPARSVGKRFASKNLPRNSGCVARTAASGFGWPRRAGRIRPTPSTRPWLFPSDEV